MFEWNDRDDQLRQAIRMAERIGVTIWFDFAHTWGDRGAESMNFAI